MEVILDTPKKKIRSGDYLEFIDYARNRKRSKKSIHSNIIDSRNTDSNWNGTKDIDEAFSFAENGWDSGIKQMELEDGVLSNGNGMLVNNSIQGSMVNMGNYLMGLPDNMLEFSELREFNLEELTIYIPLAYTASNSLAKALNYAKNITDIVNEYQSHHSVRVIGVFDTRHNDKRFINYVTIKDFNERFVLNAIAFAFHPSFFRRLWFSVLEGESFISSGYGGSNSYDKIVEEVKDEIDGKAVVIPNLDSISFDTAIIHKNKIVKINYND